MRHMLLKFFAISLLVLLVGVFVLLSLRTIDRFTIAKVEVYVQDGESILPKAIKDDLSSYMGTSLFEIQVSKLEKQYEKHPALQAVNIKRRYPSTLRIELKMAEASALLISNENEKSFLVVKNSIHELDFEDVALFKNSVPSIEVPRSYCEMMQKYGLDRMFYQVMDLAISLQEKSTLITRIKYDNNSSNSFGKMVLELSSYNAQIWVREPVGAAQVRSAVALVVKDQQQALSFLSSEPKRYDLY
ncbi:MAG: FtsQ-type POTRA domain-containing protein, partial [Spirochaetia bacterium]|nr:FtsQ-type POTRA domain-containing protein [Spirochaetia bacterium]